LGPGDEAIFALLIYAGKVYEHHVAIWKLVVLLKDRLLYSVLVPS
jgi:hypothetical protein